MSKYRLVIYDYECLSKIKLQLVNYEFVSFSFIYRQCSDINNIDDLQLDKHAIDITSYFYDVNNDRYYRTFFENYLYELMEHFPDVKLLLLSKETDNFFKIFPYLFKESKVEYFVNNEDNIEDSKPKTTISCSKKYIYSYEKIRDIRAGIDNELIYSFTHLAKSYDGINVKFDFEKLTNESIYIELTSLVEYLKVRADQIFNYELILNDLLKKNNVKYLINKQYLEQCNEIFPFLFTSYEDLPDDISKKIEEENLEKQATNNYLDNIDEIINKLYDNLHGHDKFKNDLRKNLIKYKYLNALGRRKILSVFVCGKSGIGKTELARQLHRIIFPNEKQIKLNFGNYSTKDVLNSLIGSPKGFVGSEDGGELTNKIKSSKSKIILIDEFEKADNKVFNFFYELLEDGKYTDRLGVEHDMNQYIIIFTSNLNEQNYIKFIPEPLSSRFDMRYVFEELTYQDKKSFIQKYSNELITDFKNIFGGDIFEDKFSIKYNELTKIDNLREIKKKIEDDIIALI
ncbi:AAA family ATPase [Marinisporobacter balticus]|uniref:Cdc48 subfamily AAA family protein n=1 Tax=Marinisporobacter balticus TaxID=2018667 RepID=A0A4R2L639_9FIRM|nr:AAA family ATPase [Marinisporobacter balticus]TCO79416.1 Cdc48 subfamily AAA family protein [Marinisporobacter balticus]